jgi:2-methylcitrate dehydratase PrpD
MEKDIHSGSSLFEYEIHPSRRPPMADRETTITSNIVEYVLGVDFNDLPSEALRIAKRCILDGLGLILAGSNQRCSEVLQNAHEGFAQIDGAKAAR